MSLSPNPTHGIYLRIFNPLLCAQIFAQTRQALFIQFYSLSRLWLVSGAELYSLSRLWLVSGAEPKTFPYTYAEYFRYAHTHHLL
jgi:hypothetical protein